MTILTKRELDDGSVGAMARAAFGPGTQVTGWAELTDGFFNTVAEVVLDDGTRTVLKLSPRPGLTLLTHEVDLLRTEVDVYARAAAVGLPVPAVLATDFSRTVLDSDFAFLSLVPGMPLPRAELAPELRDSLRADATALACGLHRVEGTAFGYPLRGSRTWLPTWREAFGAMIDDLLADAARLDADLPASAGTFRDAFTAHAHVLDEVRTPRLVHFDLWDGNVLVDRDAVGRWAVTGLIDAERALYGDPLAELASLTLGRELDECAEVLDGWEQGHGGALELTASTRTRVDLYTLYLLLIMNVESRTRGWESPEWIVGPTERLLGRLGG